VGSQVARFQESIAIIRERNQGMQTKDLSALLESRGIRLGGKNPVGALSGYPKWPVNLAMAA
jgi:hypothetical protein